MFEILFERSVILTENLFKIFEQHIKFIVSSGNKIEINKYFYENKIVHLIIKEEGDVD